MAIAPSPTLQEALENLRTACEGRLELGEAAKELEEAMEEDNERRSSTSANPLDALVHSHSLSTLLLAFPFLTLSVFAAALRQLVDPLSSILGDGSRATLSKDELERVKAVEARLDPLERILLDYLDDGDDRSHAPTSEEKEIFGQVLLRPLCSLLKLDSEGDKLSPALLRRVFDILSVASSHHTGNKTRLSTKATLGPSTLAQFLSTATDYELTSQALELASRLGEHVARETGKAESRERWAGLVWAKESYGAEERERLMGMFLELRVGTYESKSPAILDLLSQRSADSFQLVKLVKLIVGDHSYSHPDASEEAMSTGEYGGRAAINRFSFTASVASREEGAEEEEEVTEDLLEFGWESVEKIELIDGKDTGTLTLSLTTPPLLSSKPLAAAQVQLELSKSDGKRVVELLKTRMPRASTPLVPAQLVQRPASLPAPRRNDAHINPARKVPPVASAPVGNKPPAGLEKATSGGGGGEAQTAAGMAHAARRLSDELASRAKAAHTPPRAAKNRPAPAGLGEVDEPPAKKRAVVAAQTAEQRAGGPEGESADGSDADEEEHLKELLGGLSRERVKQVFEKLLEEEGAYGGEEEVMCIEEGEKQPGEGGERNAMGDAGEGLASGFDYTRLWFTGSPTPASRNPHARSLDLTAQPGLAPAQPVLAKSTGAGAGHGSSKPRVAFASQVAVAVAPSLHHGGRAVGGGGASGNGRASLRGGVSLAGTAEDEVERALGELSSLVLTRFTSRQTASTTFLSGAEVAFSARVRQGSDEIVSPSLEALAALASHLHKRRSALQAQLNALAVAQKESKKVGAAVRKAMG
ncbi:hypothetical protein JCM10207_004108 [Rhodosporidiobolus poonsookiae]